jgi:hypothetical protein
MSLKKKVDGVFVDVVDAEIVPGEPGTVLTSGDGELVWEAPKAKFRGAWTVDELMWVSDFGSEISEPFSGSKTGNGSLPALDASVPSGQPYTSSIYLATNPMGPSHSSTLTLDLDSLGIENPTKVKVWYRSRDVFSTYEDWGRFQILAGAAQLFSNINLTWTDVTVTTPNDATSLDFRHIGVVMDTGELTASYFTGIRIYGAAQPYMLGEFVTHSGEMWQSLVDNNSQEPAKGASAWERAITLPPPLGTTAQRPAAATAGKGYMYYDDTLGKPIWSNGTAWTDAAGTVV